MYKKRTLFSIPFFLTIFRASETLFTSFLIMEVVSKPMDGKL